MKQKAIILIISPHPYSHAPSSMELCNCFSIGARPLNSHPKLVLRLGFTRISNSLRVRVSLSDSLQNETLKTLNGTRCVNNSPPSLPNTGFSIARNGGLRLGQSRDESQKMLIQTTARILFPAKLDFTGIEDVSKIVRSSASGELATVRELCTEKRTLRSARLLLEQLKQGSLDAGDVESGFGTSVGGREGLPINDSHNQKVGFDHIFPKSRAFSGATFRR